MVEHNEGTTFILTADILTSIIKNNILSFGTNTAIISADIWLCIPREMRSDILRIAYDRKVHMIIN